MKLKITVHGVAYEVDVEVLDPGEGFPPVAALRHNRANRPESNGAAIDAYPRSQVPAAPAGQAGGGAVTSPIAGTVIEIKCKVGEAITKDQVLLVIEAMKMKTSIAAPTSGAVKNIPVAVGDAVREEQVLIELQ